MPSGFSKLSVLDSRVRQIQSLCTTLSRNHARLQTCSLEVSGTKNDQVTLEACQSPYSNALPCLARVPAASSVSIHWDPQPACRPHAHQCKCPQTKVALILNETVFFQFARQVFLPASRRCSKAQHCALSTPRDCHPSGSSGSNLQVAMHTAVRLRGLQR